MKLNVKLNEILKKHQVFLAVILVYTVIFMFAGWYMSKTGDTLEWASLILLCPALIGLAVGMYRIMQKNPGKYVTLRPWLLIVLCLITVGVCIYQSVLNFISMVS